MPTTGRDYAFDTEDLAYAGTVAVASPPPHSPKTTPYPTPSGVRSLALAQLARTAAPASSSRDPYAHLQSFRKEKEKARSPVRFDAPPAAGGGKIPSVLKVSWSMADTSCAHQEDYPATCAPPIQNSASLPSLSLASMQQRELALAQELERKRRSRAQRADEAQRAGEARAADADARTREERAQGKTRAGRRGKEHGANVQRRRLQQLGAAEREARRAAEEHAARGRLAAERLALHAVVARERLHPEVGKRPDVRGRIRERPKWK
jgi:hypothetical protein